MFVQKVKQAMSERGISQADLVRLTGLSRSGISQYLSGRNIPREKSLSVIANALSVTPEWLMDGDHKKITVQQAAELMNVTPQFVRIGLQQKLLPFGTAVMVGKERYTYYISPKKFTEYTGIKLT